MRKGMVFILLSLGLIINAYGLSPQQQSQLKQTLQTYLKDNHVDEHISAMALTISKKRGDMHTFYAGTTQDNNQQAVNKNNLFQIGSNTKAFTAVILLQLEAQHKLKMTDTVTKFFPQYKKWQHVTLTQLLDMTSGIANYSNMSAWSKVEGRNIQHHWSAQDLIDMAYPKALGSGYDYTNTGYILAGMIAQKVAGVSFQKQMQNLIKQADLNNTYYDEGVYPKSIIKRLVSGYYYNLSDPNLNPLIMSQSDSACTQGDKSTDLKCNDMSWAGAAGGVVSNTEDVTHWVRALFTKNDLLKQKQLQQLKSVVAMKTGKHISATNKEFNRAFGLGVVQGYEPKLGHYWYYQGETLGYRVMYAYFPSSIKSDDGNGLIITIATNSQSVACLNHLGQLIQAVYSVVLNVR